MDDTKNIIDRASHEETHSLLDALPHAVYECDTDGRIQYHNKAYSEITGYSSGEISGMRVWDFQVPGPECDELPGFLKQLASEQPDPVPYCCRNQTKDGRIINVQVDWRYKRDSAGLVTGFACILSDVTERLLNERILRQSEGAYRLLFQSNPNPMLVFEADSLRFLKVNDAAVAQYGYSHEEFLDLTARDIRPDEDVPAAVQAIANAPDGPMPSERLWRHRKKDGSIISVEVTSCAVEFEGKPARLAMAHDITDRVRAEHDLRQALSDKDQLISEIHHRVKNNLLIIQSLLRLQSGGIEDETSREYLLASEDRIRVISMIHERLYRSGDPRGLDAKEYIEALAWQLYRIYKANPDVIRLEVDVSAEKIDVDTAIPCGLIISELLTNSLKHAFPDGREGAIYIALKHQPGGDSLLSVRDTGVGLPDDLDIEQADSLGMKIVSTLTRQLRGSLDVERLGGLWVRVSFREKRFS